jgi:prevent-host-death family protein
MRKVGSREFKNRLGRFLAAVRDGQSLLITQRGSVVAKVSPPDQDNQSASLRDRLKDLEGKGFIRLPKRPIRTFKAVPSRGKSASRMLLEDRR